MAQGDGEVAAGFNSRAYRDTMGQFGTGVVVIAGLDAGELVGFAAQSFVSLSLEPPLIAVCPAKTSTSWPRLRSAGRFCVNVLAAEQRAVSEAFAQPGEAAQTAWTPGAAAGMPVLSGVIAYVECALAAEHDAGDHTVAVASALGFATQREGDAPLLYFRGAYGVP